MRLVLAATGCCAIVYGVACGSGASDENVATGGPGGAPGTPGGENGGSPAPSKETPPPPNGTPADPGEQGVDGPAQVQFIGRFETTDPAGPKASWPGSKIVTRFVGTAISVKLLEIAEDWMDGAPSYWDVTVDGVETKVLPMIPDLQPHDFELASGLPQGPHTIELYKRSEMQTGVTQFLGFDLKGGKALPPPARLNRHIEIMADSYGTGYGIEKLNAPDLKCGVDHAGQWQNFKKAYASLLGKRFGAEVEGTVYSGKGLLRGIWPTDTDGLVEYYNRSNPNPALANNPPLFDLKSWVPDAIILVQGTVDNGMGNFRSVYRDFVVNQLRARAPDAHIFLVVPGRVARAKFIDTVYSVEKERIAAGDLKVHAVVPKQEEAEEMTACGFHGAPEFHQRVADEIGAVMADKMGW